MLWFIQLSVTLFILVVFAIVMILILFWMTFRSSKRRQNDARTIPNDDAYLPYMPEILKRVDSLSSIPCEPVTLQSRDGLQLSGRYYHHRDGAPLALCFHGYRSVSIRDFCGGFSIAASAGHNVLLVDQRAHGNSEGHVITFGIRERLDCLDWIHYAVKRFGAEIPIYLYGVSMGAATVLMASGLTLPTSVQGIIADCPYSAPEAIIAKVVRDRHLPTRLTMPLIRLAARLPGGFRLDEASPLEAVRHTPVPILLLHGENDLFVPCSMSQSIRDANPSMIQLHTFPGAAHAISYFVNMNRYTALVHQFLTDTLPAS